MLHWVSGEDLEVDVGIGADASDVIHVDADRLRPHVLRRVETEPLDPAFDEYFDVLLRALKHLVRGLEVGPLACAPALEAVFVVPVITCAAVFSYLDPAACDAAASCLGHQGGSGKGSRRNADKR